MAEEEAVREEAQRVIAALDDLTAMEDPTAQARAISDVLRQQPHAVKTLKEIRRQYVLAQRAAKVPYRKIAAELGVSLPTVQDIERNYSGSGRDRPKSPGKRGDDSDRGDSDIGAS